MKTLAKSALLLAAALGLAGCARRSGSLLPNVSGKAGEVIVVMDMAGWEGTLGDEVRNVLSADFPYLPQREPLYSIVNLSPGGFADMFKIHRNILLFNIKNDVLQDRVVYQANVWAYPQCVIRLDAQSEESALTLFRDRKEEILAALAQAERERVIENCRRYEERPIAEAVRRMAGGSPHFPTGYRLVKQTDDFLWIQDKKQYVTQGVFVYKYPVEGDEEPFSEAQLIRHRNETLKDNVPGMRDNSWMTTSSYLDPSVRFVDYKGRKFAETRGLWDVHNDYMGGPFVSHSFYSPDGKEIITVEAFVYAPKFDKRQYLRQAEAILYSFEWAAPEEGTEK